MNPNCVKRSPHPVLTKRSIASRVRLEEQPSTAISYRLSLDNGSTWSPQRTIAPSAYGLYPALRQLLAVVEITPRHAQDAAELSRIEREIHEVIIEHEDLITEQENARLYAG